MAEDFRQFQDAEGQIKVGSRKSEVIPTSDFRLSSQFSWLRSLSQSDRPEFQFRAGVSGLLRVVQALSFNCHLVPTVSARQGLKLQANSESPLQRTVQGFQYILMDLSYYPCA